MNNIYSKNKMDESPMISNTLLHLLDSTKQQEYPDAYKAMTTLTNNKNISISQWTLVKAHLLSHHVTRWNIDRGLYLQDNSRKQILYDIMNIGLMYLRDIQLGGNMIQSIEPLSRIRIPSLQILGLDRNNIVEYKSVRKIESTCLLSLTLVQNKSKQLNILYEINCINLQEMILQYFDEQSIKFDNLTPLLKLNLLKFQSLMINSSKRIKQKILKKQIQNAYPKLDLSSAL